jgi:two-component system response regulator FixJ
MMQLRETPRGSAVGVVDDDDAVRRSLGMLLLTAGYEVQTYPNAEALLEAGPPPGLACLVVDVRMPGMDGVALIGALREKGKNLPVVVVTGHGDVPLAVRAMKAGACDFLEKPYREEELLAAIASASETPVAPSHPGGGESARRVAALSPREKEVLRGLVAGQSNKVIALDLGISVRTVEIHRANVMEKLGAESLAAVVRIALAAGMG